MVVIKIIIKIMLLVINIFIVNKMYDTYGLTAWGLLALGEIIVAIYMGIGIGYFQIKITKNEEDSE